MVVHTKNINVDSHVGGPEDRKGIDTEVPNPEDVERTEQKHTHGSFPIGLISNWARF